MMVFTRACPFGTTTQRSIPAAALASLLALTGCQLERFFPEDVGAGAARLTVRNAAILTKLIDGDEGCGFSAESVAKNYVAAGEVGQVGEVTWTTVNCVLDFGPPEGEGFDVGDDCVGVQRRAFGKVTVSATKTVKGMLTGDPTTPVIPLTNDAAVIAYDAAVENFKITFSSANNSALMQQGRMVLENEIHLAQSASLGVCSVDTSEVTMRSLRVENALYTVDNAGSVFDVEVPLLDMTAQLGLWKDKENAIGGVITVWDKTVDLGAATKGVLDPDYTLESFRAAYTCKEDLVMPQSYECPDLSATIGNGAARLLLNDVGNLVSAAVKDARCGFASPAVMQSARVTGDVGRDGGEVVFTIDAPCQIELPADTFLSRNCLGDTTTGSGKATIRGTMRQHGRVTGDPTQPIIPTSRDAVEISFDVDFDGWSVKSGTQTLIVDNGGVTGRMMPRLAKDAATGACSIVSPSVRFENITIEPGTSGILDNDGLAMGVAFQSGQLSAQVGAGDVDENVLRGDVVVDVLGTSGVALDVSGALDPAYDPARAVEAFACTPNLVIPETDADCSFDPVIAENAARLTIQTAGTLASLINANDDCGFEDTLGVLLWPTEVVGDNGDLGSMTWDVAECSISHPLTALSESCSGDTTYVAGDAFFADAGRTVRGERDKMFLDVVIDSIIPRDRNAVDIELRTVELTDFTTYAIAAGDDAPAGMLVIHRGTLSALVQPALGARADDPSTFDVPTPVARLSSVRLSGEASLYAQGKTFHFTINGAELLGTNGPFMGQENLLSGSISIDGKPHVLGALPLNPTYSSSAFDASYQCTENLGAPVR